MKTSFKCALVLVLAALVGLTASQSKIYYANSSHGKIQSANLDGTAVEDRVTGLGYPIAMAVDLANGKVYWFDNTTAKIQRANLDGSAVEDLVTIAATSTSGIALDVAAGKMYWTNFGGALGAKIERANLDGTSVETLISSGLSGPHSIALDIGAGKMYWVDSGNCRIRRANLDGTSLEELVYITQTGFWGLDLDLDAGKMYWTDYVNDKIQCANLDGTGIQDVVTAGLNSPRGIALDTDGGMMYWASYGGDVIRRANMDGSGVEDIITSGVLNPHAVDLAMVSPKREAITFQGRLSHAGAPAQGLYDFVFKLYEHPEGASQIGGDINIDDHQVDDGFFTVQLDVDSDIFTGHARWVEIGVRDGALSGPYTTLTPRQELLPVPYAMYAQASGGDSDWMISGNDMYAIPSGNVGIGTSNPQGLLDLHTGTSETSALYVRSSPSELHQGGLLHHQHGTYAWQQATDNTSSTSLGGLTFQYVNRTAPNTKQRSDVLVLRASGRVGIMEDLPSYTLDVEGNIQCTTLYETSDRRLKTNVRRLDNVLEKVNRIEGVSFEWHELAEPAAGSREQKQIGIVAQQLEKVFPELVATDDAGYKSVDYTKLTAVLIEAVKELQSENERLRQRLDALEKAVTPCQQTHAKEVK